MFKITSIFITVYLLAIGVQSKQCPLIQSMGDINGPAFMGLWYQLERYPDIFETGFKCQTANYSLNTDGTVNITHNEYTDVGDYEISYHGYGIPQPNNPSNVTEIFPEFPPMNANVLVVATDYVSYALTYSCRNLPFNQRYENAWILGRNKTISSISPQTLSQLKQMLSSKGSSVQKFRLTTQDCDN
ncbi:unnamed protein product [Oppiella nova]|uniref:Lipocalin/cytosolic fatty-acid binding domain-containing protein n=1 Tax=Oppiella nova TaxID=334625 RepID=A0A7R9QP54_9ACAR|nr:unnamed protein product [Oppiella nova]CAG2170440.1 unnamed protein product [Oppiella nova]